MKSMIAILLILGQCLIPAAQAQAASLGDPIDFGRPELGAFAGARFRVELGGRNEGQTRLGLMVTPTREVRSPSGRTMIRYGEGLELGLTSGQPASIRLAGNRFGPGGKLIDEDGRRLGVSTLGIAAIAGGVIVAGLIGYALIVRGEDGCCE